MILSSLIPPYTIEVLGGNPMTSLPPKVNQDWVTTALALQVYPTDWEGWLQDGHLSVSIST